VLCGFLLYFVGFFLFNNAENNNTNHNYNCNHTKNNQPSRHAEACWSFWVYVSDFSACRCINVDADFDREVVLASR
jgi:hypothetical protein